jgi:FAD/FMN-containing dehydrogenase
VKAGTLDRPITILRYGPATDDGYTIKPGALGIFCERKAAWKSANGRTVFESQGREALAGGTFHIRYDNTTRNISEADFVVHNSRLWTILGINELDGRREGLELLVVATDRGTILDVTGLTSIEDVDNNDGIAIVGTSIRLDVSSLTLAP